MAKELRKGGLKEVAEAVIEAKEGEGEDPVEEIDDKDRENWNEYVKFLDSKGLKGHPSLDKDDLGGKMIDEYRKVNPNTTVSREKIKPIQKEFSKYRDWSLAQIKAGKAAFAEGTNEENYMKHLSTVDGIAGQRTTSFQFPDSYLKTFENKKLKDIQRTGFATINK